MHLHCVLFSGSALCLDINDDPLEVLKIQLQEFTELVVEGNDGGRQISRKGTHSANTNTHKCSIPGKRLLPLCDEKTFNGKYTLVDFFWSLSLRCSGVNRI